MKIIILNLFFLISLISACKNRLIENNEDGNANSATFIRDSLEIIEIKKFKKLDFISHVCKNGLDDNYQSLILDSISGSTFNSKKDIVLFISSCRLYDEYRNYFINNSTNDSLVDAIRQNCNSDSCNLDYKKFKLSNSKTGISYFNESFLIIKSNRSFINGKLGCVEVKSAIENIYFITPFCEW